MEKEAQSKPERPELYISGDYGTESARVLLGRRFMEMGVWPLRKYEGPWPTSDTAYLKILTIHAYDGASISTGK